MVSKPDSVSQLAEYEEDETMLGDNEISVADFKMEMGIEASDYTNITGGKRKRGKNTKTVAKLIYAMNFQLRRMMCVLYALMVGTLYCVTQSKLCLYFKLLEYKNMFPFWAV